MSSPYAPQPARKLTRSTSNKLVGGVCAGVANYLNMDVNLVRIITVALTLFTGVPLVLYLIALFLLPEDRVAQQPPPVQGPAPTGSYGSTYGSYASSSEPYEPAPAPRPGSSPQDPVWGSSGAPWEQPQTAPTSAPEENPKPGSGSANA